MVYHKILPNLIPVVFIFIFTSPTSSQTISAGGHHNIIICQDGATMAWGQNGFGQLGIDTFSTMSDIPVTIPNFTNVKSVAAGHFHTIALKENGSVWACGRNGSGELGSSSPERSSVFVEIDTLKNIVSIASGSYHSLAIKNTGEVWAWGLNNFGQLGNSAIGGGRKPPSKVIGLTDVIAVAAGHYHSLALKSDGTVWAWGININGELGDSSGINQQVPVKVHSLDNVISIAAGISHSIALTSENEVFVWGDNLNSQLGVFGPPAFSPIKLDSLKNIVSIAGSKGNHSSALDADGKLFMWGSNGDGQLGIGHNNQPYPQVVTVDLPQIKLLANGYTYSVVMDESGQIYLWGSNIYGQLGDGSIQDAYLPQIPEPYCSILNFTNEVEKYSEIKVYPNPFISEINISSQLNMFKQIQVVDGFGRISQHVNFTETTFQTIDLSYLTFGVYFIKVIDSNGRVTTRMLVKS